MSEACSTYREEVRMVQGFGGGTFNERIYLVDQGGERRIILKLNVRMWGGETYWIGLTDDRHG
jgi:hypothetical protein